MAARNLQPREGAYKPKTSPMAIEWTLPTDLLLEIIARSEYCTLVRCAASCKLLRRDILSPPFIRRVTRRGAIIPHCILAWLNNAHDGKAHRLPPPLSLSLVHPDTPAAASYLNDHMSPYLSSNTSDLIGEHVPVTFRGGLVLFRRRRHKRSLRNYLCVLDTVTGHRTFISDPPGVSLKNTDRLLLLTAEDGIGCPFLLFLPYRADMQGGNTTKIRAATWSRGTWERAVTSNTRSGFLSQYCYAARDNTVILQGSVIHWLLLFVGKILTYNVSTREQGFIKLPYQSRGHYHLGSYYSHVHGLKLLRLLVLDGFKISVWNRLPGGGWASEAAVIDMEEKLRSLDPDIPRALHVDTGFKCSGEGSNVVLLYIKIYSPTFLPRRLLRTLLIILDMEMEEIRVQDYSTSWSVLLELDPPSCLRAMKTFPLLDSST